MSTGIVSRSFNSGFLIIESEDERGGNTEWRSEKEEPVSVAIVRDDVFPIDDFAESIEKDAKEAEDNNMESSNSSSDSHVGNEHWEGAYKSFSQTIFGGQGIIEPPSVSGEFDQVVRTRG